MSTIKIHIMHTGQVRVAQDLPFGGEHTNLLKASGLLTPASKKLWLPVSAYLIEHPKGLILVDTGWSREMSP
ncbi:N-acyl homoserine lactonase family protein, partial [Streptococcus suis]